MAPPPRPPIICYDLHTNNNLRRKQTTQTSTISTTIGSRPHSSVRYNNILENYKLINEPQPINNARYAYDQIIKDDLQEKLRRSEYKKRQLAMQEQLEAITEKLEFLKKIQENFIKTYGMGHINAKYIQDRDEEYARLKEKLYQSTEARSKELGRTIQQMKQFHELQELQRIQKEKEQENEYKQRQQKKYFFDHNGRRVLRDVSSRSSESHTCKYSFTSGANTTLDNSLASSASSSTSNSKTSSNAAISPSTFSLSSTCSSSPHSTISSPSSCSSPSSFSPSMSKRNQHVPCSVRFAEPLSSTNTTSKTKMLPPTKSCTHSNSSIKKQQNKKLPSPGYLSSSTPSKNAQQLSNTTYNSCLSGTSDLQELAKKYSFYKKDSKDDLTIEVTDDEFFEMVEDKTMLEVKGLFNEMNEALTNLRWISN